MYIIDTELKKREKEGKQIRIGLIGAGFAARGLALQLLTAAYGMKLVAISNRTLSNAVLAYTDALGEKTETVEVTTQAEMDAAIQANKHVVTTNPDLVTDSTEIDVLVEATGETEFGARVVTRAIDHKKHIVLVNAELDATLGPILKKKCDEAGVGYTQADGDQPGKLMNLVRDVEYMGFKPVMAGNIKSLIDFRRTPKTQEQWSAEHFQEPKMPTSFADGTKISVEMATIANGTGFKVGQRNMYGPRCKHVDEAPGLFPMDKLLDGGLVDYILGAEPSFGIFVLGYSDHPIRTRYMDIYKMGKGPLYTFYTPYHLSPLEAPFSIARLVLFNDVTLAPKGQLVADVITLAKFDLKKGDRLDGVGGFLTYGAIENFETSIKENLLPIGLADGAVMKIDVAQDTPITYDMVELPTDSVAVKLRKEQDSLTF
ncbi:NAD(P)-dependent oxidoreductase [Candidatus Microgenomates bacterium]|nr:NAD(P)-dependent oxidoreductase [Candidatus Microgenomates bacterium]